MLTRTYIMENLDCANCAAKIEHKMNAHPEVKEAVITFATRQLRLTAENPDALIPELTALARTVENGVEIHPREEHHDHHCHCGHDHDCTCGHGHHHEHGCHCGHDHGCNCGHHHEEEHHHDHEAGEGKSILLGAVLFLAGIVLQQISIPILSWVVLPIFTAAYLILGWNVLKTAAKNLVKGHVFDENFLMSIATLGAVVIGDFPEAVGVMLFYRVGEYFEHKAVERSRSQIMDAVDLRPETVNLVDGETARSIPAKEAVIGDLLLVRPGDRIPLDGTVVSGDSRIDTAPITGESVPVHVIEGSSVTSGCVNGDGQLVIRVEKPLSESMVTRILNSVENAAASKPKIDRFISRFARVYTPVVVTLAAIVAIVPSIITGDWNYWVYTALSFLVMSCPCALVLSVPLAFFSGIGAGSKKGILFKGGLSMEAMTRIKAVVLDKTGTLTRGDFKVQQVAGGHDVLKLCASCEQQSSHPIAKSIVAAAKERNMELFQPDALWELSGRGIRAKVDGHTVLCGNDRLMEENGIDVHLDPVEYGTRVLVAIDGSFAGFITISDTVKEDAASAINALHSHGISTVMLTGDSESAAHAVGKKVGIQSIHARLLPDQKLEILQKIRAEKGAAMFVGDGINDAPVLAGADVGAAMGSGADAAIEAADVVFMTSDTSAIPEALSIARQTNRIAWQNVVFALVIKAIVMVLGLLGYANMWMAVFADSGVAMLCVLNSIRILYRRK